MWYIVEKLPITLPWSPRWQCMCCPTNILNHKRVQFTVMWNRKTQQSSYLRHWKHWMLDTFTFINNSSCTYVLKVTLCFFSISSYVCVWGDKDYNTTSPSLPLTLSLWESLQARASSTPLICLMKCQRAVVHASCQHRYTATHGICLGSSQEGLDCVQPVRE